MKGTKVALILLILIAALFVVGVVVGAGGDRGRPGDPSRIGWARALQELLVTESRLPIADLRSGCLEGRLLVIAQGQRCFVRIDRSEDQMRRAELRLEQGSRVRLELEQSGRLPERVSLVAGAPRVRERERPDLRFRRPLRPGVADEGGDGDRHQLRLNEKEARLYLTCEQGGAEAVCRLRLI